MTTRAAIRVVRHTIGCRLPTVSLMVTMISRWVPRMISRGRSIHDSQESLIGGYDQSGKGTLHRGVRMATVLVGLGMEDSIQTVDSMSAHVLATYATGLVNNVASATGTVAFLVPIARSWARIFGRIKERYQI